MGSGGGGQATQDHTITIDSNSINKQDYYNNAHLKQTMADKIGGQIMMEHKIQFGHAMIESTPKSIVANSITEALPLTERGSILGGENIMQNYLFSQQNQKKSQGDTFTPNKLTKFISSSLNNKVQNQKSRQSGVSTNVGSSLTQKIAKQTLQKLSRSRSNSPYNTIKERPAKEQHIPRINDAKPSNRSRNTSSNNLKDQSISTNDVKSKVAAQIRSRTPNQQINNNNQAKALEKAKISKPNSNTSNNQPNEQFKQQFMQYLEVLKEKVSEMELKVRESQNERNFYKQKYIEQEDQLKFLREREKDYSVQIAQVTSNYNSLNQKYQKKKKLLTSMQATICSLSISLEQSKRDIEFYKKNFQSISKISKLGTNQFESPDVHKNDFQSRESSVQKIINDHMQQNAQSPQKSPKQSQQIDFKLVLRQKLMQLQNNNVKIQGQDDQDFDNIENGFSPIVDFEELNTLPLEENQDSIYSHENKELLLFLEEANQEDGSNVRKEKFKLFCRKYGLDNILNVQQFFTNKGVTPSNGLFSDANSIKIEKDIDIFIKFIVKKLHQEQINRLKTEEQSAQVIEQLGKTIARLELKKKDGASSSSRISTPTPKTNQQLNN